MTLQVGVLVVVAHAVGQVLEGLGDHGDRREPPVLDPNAGEHTARRARASVAQPDDAALHQLRPLLHLGPHLVGVALGRVRLRSTHRVIGSAPSARSRRSHSSMRVM